MRTSVLHEHTFSCQEISNFFRLRMHRDPTRRRYIDCGVVIVREVA